MLHSGDSLFLKVLLNHARDSEGAVNLITELTRMAVARYPDIVSINEHILLLVADGAPAWVAPEVGSVMSATVSVTDEAAASGQPETIHAKAPVISAPAAEPGHTTARADSPQPDLLDALLIALMQSDADVASSSQAQCGSNGMPRLADMDTQGSNSMRTQPSKSSPPSRNAQVASIPPILAGVKRKTHPGDTEEHENSTESDPPETTADQN